MANRYTSIFRPDLFAGQVILVTGGGTGIGIRPGLLRNGRDQQQGTALRQAMDFDARLDDILDEFFQQMDRAA